MESLPWITRVYAHVQTLSIPPATTSSGWNSAASPAAKQEREMLLGGLQGMVLYRGELTEFTQLLAAAQLLRVGKQTTFGLGWMEYRVVG